MPVKMWRGWSSVQTRLTLVVASAAALTVLALVLSQLNEARQIDAVLAADAKEHAQLLDRTLDLAGGALAAFAKDYSLWGEMVQFVRTEDRTWANVNIDVSIGTYQANAAWVFDATGALVYEVHDSILEPASEPLPSGFRDKDEFGGGHFCHFFIVGPDGPVEIRGATIQPSEDGERKTPARGYFLVARSWNREYLAGLTRLTGKAMAVGPARDRAKPTAEIARQSGQITFIRPLPAPHGKPELALTAILRPDWIAAVERSGEGLVGQLAVIALLEILGLWLALLFWVTRPLDRIRRSLESGSTKTLKPLERSRTEFGQLAQLVGQFFGQNAALVKEIAERRQAEAELAKYRDHLEELVHARTEALEMANKELETFSYSVSHDLRAPLRAINGFAQALEEDCAAQLDAVGHDYLDRVRAASRSMAELIDNLLTLARSSRLPLERKPVDLTGLTRTIARELHSAEPARQVELVIPDGMMAQADPVLAEMVLRNLLNNAWKFTGKHPTARIEVGETVRDGEPVWFVRDDGAGFDMAYVGNLSKPFQRLHGPADFPGTGIGLVTVQRLVRRHGGRGWIEGAVEKGATFYFTFQASTREA